MFSENMLLKHSRRFYLILLLILPFVVCGWTSTSAAKEPIKIGASISTTGKYAKVGAYQKEAYLLWEKLVNKQGGLLGRPVKFIIYDDESRPATGVKLYEKLITQDKVDLVLGPYSSAVTKSASVVSEKYKMPMVAPMAATTSIWERGFKYIFQVISPAEVYLEGAIDIGLRKGLKKVAVINADSLFPKASAKGAMELAKSRGMEVVFHDEFPRGAIDFSALLTKIKALNPDIILAATYFTDAVAIARQMKELDVNPKMFVVTVGGDLPEFYKDLGDVAEYIYGATQWEASLPYPGLEAFVTEYKKMWNREPDYHSAGSYAGCLILEEAINRAGALDKEKIRQALLDINMLTMFGAYKVDERGFQIAHKMLTIQWQDGKKQVVWPDKWKTAEPRFPTPEWSKR